MAAKRDADDVVSILDYFVDLEDPRSLINRKHLLGDVIVICTLAAIAGPDGPRAIRVWAASNLEWLRRYLALPGGATLLWLRTKMTSYLDQRRVG